MLCESSEGSAYISGPVYCFHFLGKMNGVACNDLFFHNGWQSNIVGDKMYCQVS